MTKTLTIELDDIVKLSSDGKTFVFNQEAEESVAQLLELQEKVERAIQDVKREIASQGSMINPGFSGVRGSRIHASYRHYGQPYKIGDILDVPTDCYTKVESYRINTTAIENYIDAKGKIPPGIIVNKREKVVSLKAL